MSLDDSKSLECLINDFVNTGVERFEDGRGAGGWKEKGGESVKNSRVV